MLSITCQRVVLEVEFVVQQFVDVKVLLPEAMLSSFRGPAAPRRKAVAHDAARSSCGVHERDVHVVFAQRPGGGQSRPARAYHDYLLARRRLQCIDDGCEPCDHDEMGVHCVMRGVTQLCNAVIDLFKQATNECDHERLLVWRTLASTLFMPAFLQADKAVA